MISLQQSLRKYYVNLWI